MPPGVNFSDPASKWKLNSVWSSTSPLPTWLANGANASARAVWLYRSGQQGSTQFAYRLWQPVVPSPAIATTAAAAFRILVIALLLEKAFGASCPIAVQTSFRFQVSSFRY